MAKNFNVSSRNILENRPTINFVEPLVRPAPITAKPELPELNKSVDDIKEVIALADNVELLATAIQARVDIKAANMKIKLDPKIDFQTINAMRRLHPEDDPTVITYKQYKECKDRMRAGAQSLVSQGLNPNYLDLQFGSELANTGGLDPNKDPNNMIVDPIDMEQVKAFIIYELVNEHVWKPIRKKMPGIVKRVMPKYLPGKPKGYEKYRAWKKKLGIGKKVQIPKIPSVQDILKKVQ